MTLPGFTAASSLYRSTRTYRAAPSAPPGTLTQLTGAALAGPELSSRANYDDVTYYDCKGKVDGYYTHPTDCTRFILCHNGRAADMACPDCGLQNNPYQCAGSEYMVYDAAMNWCRWPRDTPCTTGQTSLSPGRCPGMPAHCPL